jgi:hypothetical protein
VASAQLVPMPAAIGKSCRDLGLIRPICPTKLLATPQIAGLSLRVVNSILSFKRHVCYAEFNVLIGGESPLHPRQNQPSHTFFHIALAAGWFGSFSPFPFPVSLVTHPGGVAIHDGIMDTKRATPVAFGHRRWNGIDGYLFLAPPEALGGLFGNHLVYYWEARGADYVFSLHGWEPLTHAVATLHALINTIPPTQPPRHAPPGCRALAG